METIRDDSKRPGRLASLIGRGGLVGFVVLIIYVIVTRHHPYRSTEQSVILVALLYAFVIAMVIGMFRWANTRPGYRHRMVWQVYLVVWLAGLIGMIALAYLWYRYVDAHGMRGWERALMLGGVCGLCGWASSKFGLRPKSMLGDEPPVELALVTGPTAGQNTFTLTLNRYPAHRKIAVIKVIREVADLGLREAKDLVESVPCVVKPRISRPEVEDIKQKLEELGARVEIK